MEKKLKKPIIDQDERELAFTLLSEKVGAVDPKDIFNYSPGTKPGKYIATLEGKRLTTQQLSTLRQEAHLIKQTQLWRIFTATLANEANLRMFKLAKTTEDLNWGKSILHAVSVIETIVNAIDNAEEIAANGG